MKNLRSLLTNVGLLLVGVLFLVFMSQPYTTVSIDVPGYKQSSSVGGFKILEDATGFSKWEAKEQFQYVALVFTIIFVCVMLLVTLLNFLVTFNVLKSEKLAKVLDLVNVAAAVLLLVFVICVAATTSSLISDSMKLLSAETKEYYNMSLGWGLILNIVLSVVAAGLTVFSLVFRLRKKS